MDQFIIYLEVGWTHIIDSKLYTDVLQAEGYDHLLFIIALASVYRLKDIKAVIWMITAFTVGHCITLALSALDIFTIDPSITEKLIPATIVFTAAYNLWSGRPSIQTGGVWRFAMALFFGLIHGMGFSYLLRSMIRDRLDVVVPLLGFNVGIELAQIAIVLIYLVFTYILLKLLPQIERAWFILVNGVVLLMSLKLLWGQF